MENKKQDEYIQTVNSATGEIGYVLKSDLDNPEKYELLQDKNGKTIIITKDQYKKFRREMDGMRGCFAIITLFAAAVLSVGCIWLITNAMKKTKERTHKNVISYINQSDQKLIISDIKTHEERLIDYSEYNYKLPKIKPDFKEQIKRAKTGDTIVFVSPDYDSRRKFKLKQNPKTHFYLNTDSIIARMKAEKIKQNLDSLSYFKPNQR